MARWKKEKPKRDVEDALVWSVDLRDTLQELVAEGRIPEGAIDTATPPKPDPEHPGRGFLAYPQLAKRMKGGHVWTGYVDCDRCGVEFYIEVAVNRKGWPEHSLGGVAHPPDIFICDECSPI